MRWRLIDRVESFEPWKSARGIKAVSLEEYSLLKPFGRRGFFPESLALESGVELARLLIEKSSGFGTTSILEEVEAFRIFRAVDRGAVLRVSVEQLPPGPARLLHFSCRIECEEKLVADGRIAVRLFPLAEAADPDVVAGLWEELHASP